MADIVWATDQIKLGPSLKKLLSCTFQGQIPLPLPLPYVHGLWVINCFLHECSIRVILPFKSFDMNDMKMFMSSSSKILRLKNFVWNWASLIYLLGEEIEPFSFGLFRDSIHIKMSFLWLKWLCFQKPTLVAHSSKCCIYFIYLFCDKVLFRHFGAWNRKMYWLCQDSQQC